MVQQVATAVAVAETGYRVVFNTGAEAGQTAVGLVYQALRLQASVLAYLDIFGMCSLMAFAVVPLALLLSAQKGGKAGAGAH